MCVFQWLKEWKYRRFPKVIRLYFSRFIQIKDTFFCTI